MEKFWQAQAEVWKNV